MKTINNDLASQISKIIDNSEKIAAQIDSEIKKFTSITLAATIAFSMSFFTISIPETRDILGYLFLFAQKIYSWETWGSFLF